MGFSLTGRYAILPAYHDTVKRRPLANSGSSCTDYIGIMAVISRVSSPGTRVSISRKDSSKQATWLAGRK